jgi:hypothetical protein
MFRQCGIFFFFFILLQNTTQKTKDRATQTPQKTVDEFRRPEM